MKMRTTRRCGKLSVLSHCFTADEGRLTLTFFALLVVVLSYQQEDMAEVDSSITDSAGAKAKRGSAQDSSSKRPVRFCATQFGSWKQFRAAASPAVHCVPNDHLLIDRDFRNFE